MALLCVFLDLDGGQQFPCPQEGSTESGERCRQADRKRLFRGGAGEREGWITFNVGLFSILARSFLGRLSRPELPLSLLSPHRSVCSPEPASSGLFLSRPLSWRHCGLCSPRPRALCTWPSPPLAPSVGRPLLPAVVGTVGQRFSLGVAGFNMPWATDLVAGNQSKRAPQCPRPALGIAEGTGRHSHPCLPPARMPVPIPRHPDLAARPRVLD